MSGRTVIGIQRYHSFGGFSGRNPRKSKNDEDRYVVNPEDNPQSFISAPTRSK
jgi:hypothetical protein